MTFPLLRYASKVVENCHSTRNPLPSHGLTDDRAGPPVASWWVARLGPDAERNGLALGVIVAVLDLTLLIVSGAPFSALMVLSAIGRIGGGYVGGWWAGRRLSALSVPVPSRTS